jgi:hypothetical protein
VLVNIFLDTRACMSGKTLTFRRPSGGTGQTYVEVVGISYTVIGPDVSGDVKSTGITIQAPLICFDCMRIEPQHIVMMRKKSFHVNTS